MADCDVRCQEECVQVFSRVFVWPQISAGETRVEWSLSQEFRDAGPLVFQLQGGRTGLTDADDWTDIGGTVTDTYYAVDDTKRVYGKFQWTHYRVKLVSADGTYYSKPANALGVLKNTDWNRAREILRMEHKRLVKEAGQEGYLLKRRLYGTPCSCLDPVTKEITKPQHSECYGTGVVYGYFDPFPCCYVEQTPIAHRSHLDSGAMRGTIDDDTIVKGRMLNVPQVFSYDVWVDRDTDFRWAIHKINSVAEIRGVSLVIQAEMRLLPFTDPVYRIAIDGQVPSE